MSSEARTRAGAGRQLTPTDQRQLAQMQQTDAHVRQHEAAHQAAGGSLTGGATFTYQLGPDGKSYAVGGEVPVTLQTGRTPDETIANARQARRAALAPSDPSPQDLAVAAEATQMELSAQARKAKLATQAYARQVKRREAQGTEAVRETAGGSSDPSSEAIDEPIETMLAAA